MRKQAISKIIYTSRFERSYRKLTSIQKQLAEEKEKIVRNNVFDPKLRTHKLTGKLSDYWSFSLTYSHRVLFRFINDNTVLFYDIGDHRVYR